MNLQKVLSRKFEPVEHTITPRDCMLYALGIGVGARPDAKSDLQFAYEEGLKVFPAMVNVISHPGGWIKDPDLAIDWVKVLHGEQSFAIHRPLSPGKTYVGTFQVTDVIDKGEGKGAMLYLTKTLREKGSDEPASTVTYTLVLRGDGGSGGTKTQAPAVHPIPETPAQESVRLPTLPQAALVYRLSGDYNPIHADPTIARKAGFERPILHGLCTLGVVTRAVLQTCCGDEPERLKTLKARFSSPVYPGETIVTEVWRGPDGVASFRASVPERNVVVLNNGRAEYAA
jgi:acyl dehydratase